MSKHGQRAVKQLRVLQRLTEFLLCSPGVKSDVDNPSLLPGQVLCVSVLPGAGVCGTAGMLYVEFGAPYTGAAYGFVTNGAYPG